MFSSCSQFNQAENSGSEVDAIYDAIESVATATQVDHRFILAVIMQESGGCVRVPTNNWGVRNPGLLQDHNGAGSCNDNGQVQTPCPAIVVHQMVSEGTAGTADGDGLAQCINESGAGDVSAFYKAARIYNSGSVDPSGDLNKGISTYCYASDIANRLTGWVMAPYGCYLDGA
ncbi:glycoside hydrolase [Lasallia pustulata]|uniref:Glycoside hydrolase n=1 Tax=Lasallia pustulata TaxID=136370 RepID=A0A1W5D9R8_9LECA|nr:glycoside hydrolase [Lasallia pustulata]